MFNARIAIATLAVGLAVCGSCFAQESDWQTFRKKISENAQKIRQLEKDSEVKASDLFLVGFPEYSKRIEMVTPLEFVSSLPSDFDLETYMMFANVSSLLLPCFRPSSAESLNFESEESFSDSQRDYRWRYRAWHEEASKLICYRLVSDRRFRASYLRLGAWNCKDFWFELFNSEGNRILALSGPFYGARDLIKPGAYTSDSLTFWTQTREFMCCALTTGYDRVLERVLNCDQHRESLIAEAASFSEYMNNRSFVKSNDLPGWKPTKLASGGKTMLDGAEPSLPVTPIDDLPSSLEPDLELLKQIMN